MPRQGLEGLNSKNGPHHHCRVNENSSSRQNNGGVALELQRAESRASSMARDAGHCSGAVPDPLGHAPAWAISPNESMVVPVRETPPVPRLVTLR